ncbi:MAG: MarR family transcriptional regulator [Pseudomonadota bacterium]
MRDETLIDELTGHVNLIIRALLVAGRKGAPAEGRIPFNPLYFNVLRILGANGPSRPSYLADALSVPRTTMSTATKALINRGLIQTSADSEDKRALSLSLTIAGEEVLDAILRQDRRNSEAMLDTLNCDEREAFVAAIGKVARGVNGG